jgi:hypothetical protein
MKRSANPGGSDSPPGVGDWDDPTMAATDTLGTYLTDHLGGANAGVQIAQRLWELVGDGPDAAVVRGLPAEIEEDRDYLRNLVARLGGDRHRVKRAAGWVAGKVHRLAVDERVTGDRHLSTLREAESLSLGIEGKLNLWEALLAVRADRPQLVEHDLVRLATRAREQRRRVEVVRLAAARRAFPASRGGTPGA